jgi:ribonuclease P protein component
MSPNRVFNRLHKRKDILRVIRGGRRVRGPYFDLLVLQDEGEKLRIAVVVPLLGKCAVERNRLKRRMKDALRGGDFLREMRGDIVIRARKEAYELGYIGIVEELRSSFRR